MSKKFYLQEGVEEPRRYSIIMEERSVKNNVLSFDRERSYMWETQLAALLRFATIGARIDELANSARALCGELVVSIEGGKLTWRIRQESTGVVLE